MKNYLVWIQRNPTFTGNTLPGHREYIGELKDNKKIAFAGGFSDQTGGAYVLNAESMDEAIALAAKDPMNNDECNYSIKEWNFS